MLKNAKNPKFSIYDNSDRILLNKEQAILKRKRESVSQNNSHKLLIYSIYCIRLN